MVIPPRKAAKRALSSSSSSSSVHKSSGFFAPPLSTLDCTSLQIVSRSLLRTELPGLLS